MVEYINFNMKERAECGSNFINFIDCLKGLGGKIGILKVNRVVINQGEPCQTLEERARQAREQMKYYFWTADVIQGTIPQEMVESMEKRKEQEQLEGLTV